MTFCKKSILLALLSGVLALFVNEDNLRNMRDADILLRDAQTVITADDASYLQPMVNLLESGRIYRNEIEKHSSILRSPGYGLTYFVNAVVFGKDNALWCQKIMQLLWFAFSVWCFAQICRILLKDDRWAFLTACIYGLLPFSMGFLYYTLTEAITPALVIFFVYLLMQAGGHKQGKAKAWIYIAAAFVLSFLILTRPVMAILGLALPFFLWCDYRKDIRKAAFWLRMFLLALISLSMFGLWQVRNVAVLKKQPSVFPVYQNEIPGLFRTTHKAVGGFYFCFEDKGYRFHETLVPIWEKILGNQSVAREIETAISNLPEHVQTHFGYARLHAAFLDYKNALLAVEPYYNKKHLMPKEPLPREKTAIQSFHLLKKEYQRKFWFRYHVVTPLKVFKNMVLHSNLSLYMFQHTYRGNVFIEILRWLCLIIHTASFILCLFFIFTRSPWSHKMLFSISILLYILLLAYFQRGIEERYTLPILPLVLLSAIFVVKASLESIKKIIFRRNLKEESTV